MPITTQLGEKEEKTKKEWICGILSVFNNLGLENFPQISWLTAALQHMPQEHAEFSAQPLPRY